MSNIELMTKEELLDFGIETIIKTLPKMGYTIIDVQNKNDVYPHVVASKNDVLYFIVVAVEMYPNMPDENSIDKTKLLNHSKLHNAIPCFAPIGFGCSDKKYDMSQPVKGAPFYANFVDLIRLDTND